MKQGKSGGPTAPVSHMLKAAGATTTLWMTDACNAVPNHGKTLDAWSIELDGECSATKERVIPWHTMAAYQRH